MKKNILRIKEKLEKILVKSKVLQNEPMSKHTSMRVGGPADIFIILEDTEEFKKIISLAKRMKISLSVIGSGTNLLVGDAGIRGITVKPGRAFNYIRFKNGSITAGGATQAKKLLEAAMQRGLGGIEFLCGLPGSIGGAVIGNAGFPKRSIGDFVERVKVIDFSGRSLTLTKKDLEFYYRGSSLKGSKLIITEVILSDTINVM